MLYEFALLIKINKIKYFIQKLKNYFLIYGVVIHILHYAESIFFIINNPFLII